MEAAEEHHRTQAQAAVALGGIQVLEVLEVVLFVRLVAQAVEVQVVVVVQVVSRLILLVSIALVGQVVVGSVYSDQAAMERAVPKVVLQRLAVVAVRVERAVAG